MRASSSVGFTFRCASVCVLTLQQSFRLMRIPPQPPRTVLIEAFQLCRLSSDMRLRLLAYDLVLVARAMPEQKRMMVEMMQDVDQCIGCARDCAAVLFWLIVSVACL